MPPANYDSEEQVEDEYEESDDEEESDEEEEADEVVGEVGMNSSPQAVYGDDRSDDVNFAASDALHASAPREVLTVDDDVVSEEGDVTASLKSMDELDGLVCPICYEAWTCGGDHHICCLPCGHIYGLSCIKKWLGRLNSSKCPQCKKKCSMKGIRLLFASRIVAVDGALQKKVRSLEAKCVALQKKERKREAEWKEKEVNLSKQLQYLRERTCELENLLGSTERRDSASPASTCSAQLIDSKIFLRKGSSKFLMQMDFRIDGARLLDIDSYSETVVIARRVLGMGGVHMLTKMSLLSHHKTEDISLPDNTNVVKDLRVSPHHGLVLLASLGKSLSIVSTKSNDIALSFNLPAAAWSCSWDISSPHYAYAGLQDGTVLLFDTRQTIKPVESLKGLSENPIHSLQSLSPHLSMNTGVRSVLTASSPGLCLWNFGGTNERPYLIPSSESQGVCISMAYCPTSEDIVATYRPKFAQYGDSQPSSQATLSGSSNVPIQQSVRGTHAYYRRRNGVYQNVGASPCNVSSIRLPRTAIMGGHRRGPPLFASENEATGELLVHELPSLTVTDHVKLRRQPIRDVKYTPSIEFGLLCCLSDDSLQLFAAKPFGLR